MQPLALCLATTLTYSRAACIQIATAQAMPPPLSSQPAVLRPVGLCRHVSGLARHWHWPPCGLSKADETGVWVGKRARCAPAWRVHGSRQELTSETPDLQVYQLEQHLLITGQAFQPGHVNTSHGVKMTAPVRHQYHKARCSAHAFSPTFCRNRPSLTWHRDGKQTAQQAQIQFRFRPSITNASNSKEALTRVCLRGARHGKGRMCCRMEPAAAAAAALAASSPSSRSAHGSYSRTRSS